LTNAGIWPQQIETHLQQLHTIAEELPLTSRDIYNVEFQLMCEALRGQTPIQALLSQFAADDYVREYQVDANGHLTHMFFAS
jgi:hypothetical protein